MRTREEIRNFRNSLAGKSKVKPSAVFPDESIEMLYRLQPKTLSELAGKSQFPAKGKRIEIYGEELIKFFNPATTNSPVSAVESMVFNKR